MSKHAYDSPAQQRILRALTILAGHEFTGVTPTDYAKALQVTQSTATRDLHNLHAVGFAEEIPGTGRWRLGPRPVQIALAFSSSLQAAEARLGEIKNRYTREI